LALADPRPMSLKEKQRMTQFILRPQSSGGELLLKDSLPCAVIMLLIA
jgi:hypothetical protein